MKKSILAFFTVLMLLLSSFNVFAATYINDPDIIYYNDSPYYDVNFGGSGLTGYNGSYTGWITGGYKYYTLKPSLVQGGKYRVYFYNIPYSSNVPTVEVCVYDKDGNLLGSKEIDHKTGKEDFYEIGEFDFTSGYSSYVTFGHPRSSDNVGDAGGYCRCNCIKLELVEGYDDYLEADLEETYSTQKNEKILEERNISLPTAGENAIKIYVAQNGNGDGSSPDSPLGSIADAQKKAREYIKNGENTNGINVLIKGGQYHLTDTLKFTNEDSGSETAPVIYEGYDGEVIFTGAYVFGSDEAKKVTDESVRSLFSAETADNLRVIDLKTQNLDVKYLEIPMSDWAGVSFKEKVEIGGKTYSISQYPNVGETPLFLIDGSTRGANEQKRNKGGSYSFRDAPRIARWTNEKQIVCNGRFSSSFELMSTLVTEINTEKMYLSVLKGGALVNAVNPTAIFRNILSETDMPGEYYFDRDNDLLYYYPYEETNADIYVNTGSYDGISVDNASHVTFKGISLKMFGGKGVSFNENSSDCMFAGGNISNVSTGAYIKGKRNTVRDCNVSSVDYNGIEVHGGKATTFERGDCLVANNTITNVGMAGTTQMHGVSLSGCGNSVENNHIYEIKGQGVLWVGNHQYIAQNLIEQTCREFTDAGGIYTASDFVWGSVIKNNIIRGVLGESGGLGNNGIYYDNGTVGNVTAEGNILMDVESMFTYTGTNMLTKNNVMIFSDFSVWGISANLGVKILNSGNKEQYDTTLTQYDREAAKATDKELYEFLESTDGQLTRNKKFINNVCFNMKESEKVNYENVKANAAFKQYGGECKGDLFYDEKPSKADFSDIPWEKIYADNPEFEEISVNSIGVYKGGMRTDEKLTYHTNSPVSFNLLYPENNATELPTTVNFMWDNIKKLGNEKEIFYIAENAEFTDNFKIFYGDAGSLELELDPDTTYYWTVVNEASFGYGKRLNEGGVNSFTTKSYESLYAEKSVEALTLIRDTVEGEEFSQYAAGAKKSLKTAYDEINASENDAKTKSELLQNAIDEFKSAQEQSKELATLIYNDMESDVIGDRSLNFFVRNSRKDTPFLVEYEDETQTNKVATIRIDKSSTTAGATYGGEFTFPRQDNYLECYTSVKMNSDGAVGSIILASTKLEHYGDYKKYHILSPIEIIFEGGNIYPSINKSSYPTAKYEVGQWYDICLKINIAKKVYDVYANGEIVAANVAFNPVPDGYEGLGKYLFTECNGICHNSGGKVSEVGSSLSIDNIILRAPKNYGENYYLNSLSVNDVPVSGFEEDVYIYNVDMTAEELANAKITYTASDSAKVGIYNLNGKTFVSVLAGNYSDILVYTLIPTK